MVLCTSLFAQKLTLNTNLRVAQEGKEKLAALMLYNITLDKNELDFDCTNCNLDYKITLTENVTKTVTAAYNIETFNTTETDQVSLIYKANILFSICIHQSNGVDLFYLKSEIKIENKTVSL